jgi:hypothetical protein
MRRIRPRSLYDVLALISFFLVIGGGTALASYVVSSNSQIGPGTVSGHNPPTGKHANVLAASINATDLATGAVSSAKLGTSAVTSAKIANGAVTAPKLAANAIGARAYGRIEGTSVTRSKNITHVTNPNPGLYCITLGGGINAASTGAVVTPDYSSDATVFGANGHQTIAEWSTGGDCPGGQLEVVTGYRSVQTSGGNVTSVNNTGENEPFFVVVP